MKVKHTCIRICSCRTFSGWRFAELSSNAFGLAIDEYIRIGSTYSSRTANHTVVSSFTSLPQPQLSNIRKPLCMDRPPDAHLLCDILREWGCSHFQAYKHLFWFISLTWLWEVRIYLRYYWNIVKPRRMFGGLENTYTNINGYPRKLHRISSCSTRHEFFPVSREMPRSFYAKRCVLIFSHQELLFPQLISRQIDVRPRYHSIINSREAHIQRLIPNGKNDVRKLCSKTDNQATNRQTHNANRSGNKMLSSCLRLTFLRENIRIKMSFLLHLELNGQGTVCQALMHALRRPNVPQPRSLNNEMLCAHRKGGRRNVRAVLIICDVNGPAADT